MPIRFRCSRCNRLLGIARRKAGAETRCPHCGATILVPREDDTDEVRTQFDDIDELINPADASGRSAVSSADAVAKSPQAVVVKATPPPIPRSSRPAPKPAADPIPLPHEERPLFERDMEAVLEVMNATAPSAESPRAKPTASGMDAMSLEPDRGHLVLSSQMATALAVVVVVLMALSFGAGYLIASR